MAQDFCTHDFRKDLEEPIRGKALFVNQERYWAETDFSRVEVLGSHLLEWYEEYPGDLNDVSVRLSALYNAKQVWAVFAHPDDVYDVAEDIIMNHHVDENFVCRAWWADQRGWDCRLCFILFEKVLYLLTMYSVSEEYDDEPTGKMPTDDSILAIRRLRKLNLLLED